ncbi:hypothetical protein F5144DRAFT_565027 [Chaetomium tenue]|uniref:Uncharacterized protein n=1 Tax=Chaetomium tenue TaxID=1854479 RepID=A0ACB7PP67_9PEZI|nr:hypothetical protein F5144DRAFT_565027 [Chaetomium globosum]
MDPVSITGLALTCLTLIQGFTSLVLRGKKIYDGYKNAPRRVQRLLRHCDDWKALIYSVRGLLAQGKLLDKAVRAQLETCLDDINDLLEEADGLITDCEAGNLQNKDKFADLGKSFDEERARLHIWMDVAHSKVTKRDTKKIDKIARDTTETRETVQNIWNEVKHLQAQSKGLVRPAFNQSLTDLAQLANDELGGICARNDEKTTGKIGGKRPAQASGSKVASGVHPETSRPVYVDGSTQTEPLRSAEKIETLPPLSQFPPEIDLDRLPNRSDFPVWVSGVPITVGGSSPRIQKRGPITKRQKADISFWLREENLRAGHERATREKKYRESSTSSSI